MTYPIVLISTLSTAKIISSSAMMSYLNMMFGFCENALAIKTLNTKGLTRLGFFELFFCI